VSNSPRSPARRTAAALAAALAFACATPPPLPPPPAPKPVAAVDLSRVGKLGILPFAAVGDVSLEPVARRGFIASVREVQPGAPMLELRSEAAATTLSAAAARALGRKHGVDAVLVGQFWADAIDPVEFMRRARKSPEALGLEGTLALQIFETQHGTVIWSANAVGQRPITRVRIDAWGQKSVDTSHLYSVRIALVDDLVAQTTEDFRPRLPGTLADAPAPPATETEPVAPPASAAP
jgi:hypothetical protein